MGGEGVVDEIGMLMLLGCKMVVKGNTMDGAIAQHQNPQV